MNNCIETIIKKYFDRENIFVIHQIGSYDNFIDKIVPSILSKKFPIICSFNDKERNIKRIEISIVQMNTEKPYYTENNGCSKPMTPSIARLRNYTYSLSVILTLKVKVYNYGDNDEDNLVSVKDIKDVILGKIPIVVKSKYCTKDVNMKECKYDVGGYFIINGNEKVLIAQEKIIANKIQIFKNMKNSSKYGLIAEMRSLKGDSFGISKCVSIKFTYKKQKYENKLYILIPHIKQDIPLFLVFKALGCISDKEIIYTVIDNDNMEIDIEMIKLIKSSLEEVSDIHTERDAILKISEYLRDNRTFTSDMRYKYSKNILETEMMSHCESIKEKIHYLGLMTNKLIKADMGLIKTSDRDNYNNKRLETCGSLLGTLFYQGLLRIVKDIRSTVNKEVSSGHWCITQKYDDIINSHNISKMIKSSYIESILKSSLVQGTGV